MSTHRLGLRRRKIVALTAFSLLAGGLVFFLPAVVFWQDVLRDAGVPIVNSFAILTGVRFAGNVDEAAVISAHWQSLPVQSVPVGDKIYSMMSPVHENWKNGMDAYYYQMTAAVHLSGQQSFTATTEYRAAQRAFQNTHLLADNHAIALSASPPASGIYIIGHPISLEVFLIFVVLIVLLLGLAFLVANRSRRQRRRTLKSELAAAERRATIEAARIRQAEMGAAQNSSDEPQSPPPAPLAERTHTEVPRAHSGELAPTVQACPRCGAINALNAQYCGNCRLPLTDEAVAQESAQASVPQSPAPVPSSAPARSRTEYTSVVPARAITEQPTVVPELSPITEQPTVDLTLQSATPVAESEQSAYQNDPQKTVPYAMRQLRGSRLGFVVGTRSDPGIKRRYKPNEDSLFAAQGLLLGSSTPALFGLFVVADGMGGHANGEDASRLAIQTIVNYILPRIVESEPRSNEAYTQLLIDGVQQANLAVHQNNMEQRADMGTTITATLLVENLAFVANVGDSRTYLYRVGNGLRKVTTDHSVVASLVEAGIIKPDDIYTHPKRHQIYRSLGEKPGVEIDAFTVQLQKGDKLLLCSDGLWDMVRDPKIEAVIQQLDIDPNVLGDALVQSALDGGGEDNVSVIVVCMVEAVDTRRMPRIQLLDKPETVQMPTL